jgi:hypothetical protein
MDQTRGTEGAGVDGDDLDGIDVLRGELRSAQQQRDAARREVMTLQEDRDILWGKVYADDGNMWKTRAQRAEAALARLQVDETDAGRRDSA